MRFAIVLVAILIKHGAFCEDIEAELRRLPKLYHLDDFEKCLARKDGIYCLGQFEIYSDIETNPLYDLIQEKSQDVNLYNRSYLHRGYCLPTRCPSREVNASARFERCADAWARGHSLRARLRTLHYCRAHGQPPPVPDRNDTPHQVFLYVVYAFLFMNALGTLYDIIMGPKTKKNKVLMMFSLRSNWQKIMSVQDSGDASVRGLNVLNGLKAGLLLGAIVSHVGIVTAQAWQYNPRFMEKFLVVGGAYVGSLTTTTQSFVLISNFLTTYNLLLSSHVINKMGFYLIPVLVLKRIVRLLPVYMLVNGFSATWWTKIGDGPLWPLLVGSESKVCRDKFWPQAFFLQNMFEPKLICNVQTWVMAVDIQLFIPSLIITLLLMKRQKWAIKILLVLLAGATALTGYVALTRQYIPAFNYLTPENFREMLINEKTFSQFFILPINCLMTMILGILLGFIYYNDVQRQGAKDEKKTKPSKIMAVLNYVLLPVVFIWSYFCIALKSTDPVFMALMIPIERLVHMICFLMLIYTSTKVKTCCTKFLGWRGLRVVGRVSLSLSMVHWCVNKTLVANRSTLHDSSYGMLFLDTIGVSVISFALAIVLTLFVECPMSKLMDRLLSYLVRQHTK